MKRLIYFTATFPYGLGESWKTNDLNVFRDYFDEVILQPLTYGPGGCTDWTGVVPDGIKTMTPMFRTEQEFDGPVNVRNLSNVIFDRRLLRELTSNGRFLNKRVISSCVRAARKGKLISKAITERGYCNGDRSVDTHFFFFWGLGAAEAIPWLPSTTGKIVVGYHNYDLYEDRHNIRQFPFRSEQLARIHIAAPCSSSGALHLKYRYPNHQDKVVVRHLGASDTGLAPWRKSSIIRIVSISNFGKVKRIPLMIESLAKCTCRISWTHIGGGDGSDNVLALANSALKCDRVDWKFMGTMPAAGVREYLGKNEFDVLLSTSEYEGLPVSMIEAFCCGIPVIGTKVGGVEELVDDKTGILVESSASPLEFAKVIDNFSEIPEESLSRMRRAARAKFECSFRAPEVIHRFAKIAFA